MMQNWASSDEESDDENHHPAKLQPAIASQEDVHDISDDEAVPAVEEFTAPLPPVKTFEFPTEPPFTAFVGNLAFSVQEPEDLSTAITNLLQERFQKTVHIVAARVAIDRRENKHKGFGYLELETVEDLKTVLELDDGQSRIAGRVIKLDVAQPHSSGNRNPSNRGSLHRAASTGGSSSRGSSFSETLDGSQFRGGRFAGGRASSTSSLGSGRPNNSAPESSEPRQRPSLKLAPRSKPMEAAASKPNNEPTAAAGGSSSSIFGDGKARNGTTWQRKTSTDTAATSTNTATDRRESSGRGGGRAGGTAAGGGPSRGRGGGRGGPSGGRSNSGRGGRGGRTPKEGEAKKPTEEAPTRIPPPAAVVAAAVPEPQLATTTKKVVNKFEALQFDSDSE